MDEREELFETLKQVLRQIRDPQSLNDHPWTRSLIVREALEDDPRLRQACPGQQLIAAIVRLFSRLQPPAPPRRGKRLDPRWGEFGLLAALYFTPFNHGTPYPAGLLDAWARIDPAILYFVFGKSADELGETEIERYRLVGKDLEFGSASTLSDWHRKGLQRFTGIVLDRERYLSRSQSVASILLEPETDVRPDRTGLKGQSRSRRIRRLLGWSFVLGLLLALGLAALQGWRIYQSGMLVYRDVRALQSEFRRPVEPGSLDALTHEALALQKNLSNLKQEARPVLWLSPGLGWVPEYGEDLKAAPELIGLSEHLLNTLLLSSEAAGPLLEAVDGSSDLDPAGLTALLVEAQPALQEARHELDAALAVRADLDGVGFSPRLQSLLVEDLDPLLDLADDGLSLSLALPEVLGAGSSGPKTYLLLAQNEDELRPTGGFITSVGNLVIHQGRVISLEFEPVDSEVQEDWMKPYPAAPWQLQEYMNSRVLILRDANWFSDFPTSARWVEYLYAYKHDHSVDGVIAFDQQFLVMLLEEIGPLDVQDAPYPITAQNVIEYMRAAKIPPQDGERPPDWYRKEFIGQIAEALLTQLNTGNIRDGQGMAQVLSRALEERHLLLQLDDPDVASLAAEYGMDNAIRPGPEGDFLLVTDTNIGFNKTNAVVEVSLVYDVDLTDPDSPEGTLTILHTNRANSDIPCIHWNDEGQITGEKWYPINRCYWTYTRLYRPAGVELVEATPHAIPGGWMLLGRNVPARVDDLEEELPGVRGFGTLLVVPGGDSLMTRFRFALPVTVLTRGLAPGQLAYHLHFQKQPGTLAHPLVIRIHLPEFALLDSVPSGAIVQGGNLLVETSLQTDVELEILFSIP